MAVIGRFIEAAASTDRVDPTIVDCEWQIVRAPRKTLVQLTTFGSADRKFPGKASQKVQLDEEGARSLLAILRRAFPHI